MTSEGFETESAGVIEEFFAVIYTYFYGEQILIQS